MKRKDIKVGMRVKPSGRGFTKYWNLSIYMGVVTRMGKNYITVLWDGYAEPSSNLKPMHLEPA